jgi:methionine-rich copper-binding protein CopC
MSGSGVAFTLGFDRPLDHTASYFTLVAPDGHERTFRLRLNTQPNTLYASVGRLGPGNYELHWQARAADGHTSSGAFPFTVSTDGPLEERPSSPKFGAPERATRRA